MLPISPIAPQFASASPVGAKRICFGAQTEKAEAVSADTVELQPQEPAEQPAEKQGFFAKLKQFFDHLLFSLIRKPFLAVIHAMQRVVNSPEQIKKRLAEAEQGIDISKKQIQEQFPETTKQINEQLATEDAIPEQVVNELYNNQIINNDLFEAMKFDGALSEALKQIDLYLRLYDPESEEMRAKQQDIEGIQKEIEPIIQEWEAAVGKLEEKLKAQNAQAQEEQVMAPDADEPAEAEVTEALGAEEALAEKGSDAPAPEAEEPSATASEESGEVAQDDQEDPEQA